jgi:ubiquinone/menaquinone biosynthesis C-methylase UbiE
MTERTSERDYIPGMGKHYLFPFYDLAHRVFGLHAIQQEMITLARLADGHKVLDVGCGTGNLLRSTGKRHPRTELTGLDPDPKMLATTRRKTRRAGLSVRLDRGFAQELPYADDEFDRVFSSLMFHHLDTAAKDQLLAEVKRVLKPGGVLVLADAVFHDHGPHRMKEMIRDNVGDRVAQRISAAGFDVEPTRRMPMRVKGIVGVEVARPQP